MATAEKRRLVIEPLPGFEPEIGRWIGALEDARSRTRRALEGLNPSATDGKMPGSRHTIGTLLYHIAAIEMDWLYADVLQQEWPQEAGALFPYEVRDDQGNLVIVTGHSLESYWARLVTVRSWLLDAYRPMTLEQYRRPRSGPDYEVSPEWVLHHLCQHEAEHRGELIALRQAVE